MRSTVIPVAILGLAVLGLAAPTAAMADGHISDDVPRLIITVVCTIYSEHLDEAISGIDLATGINLDQYAPDCEMTAEYVEATPSSSETVAIPDGALFPGCQVTNDCFTPYTVVVGAGTGVTWTNNDTVLHTVTGDQPNPDGTFDSWLLPGEEFTFTFDTPGTYEYGCTVHPWAKGVVVVEPEAGAIAEPAAPETMTASPNVELAFDQVDELIAQYKENGEAAFDEITELNPDREVVGFIVSVDDYIVVAHNSNPLFRGFAVEPLLNTASIPIDVMLQIIEDEDEGVWLSYPRPDPQGNIIGYERGWFKLYDGYVFAARYSVTVEERVQGIVEEMIRVYDRDPSTAFATIDSFMSQSPEYPFVLDPDTSAVVAHGQNPDRVGATSVVLTNSTVSLETFRGLEDREGVWTEYTFLNPETGEEQLKRSWIVMHDGYLFGSGYYP